MTPRQLEANLILAVQLHRSERAERVWIAAMGARGEEKALQRAIRDTDD